MVCVMVNASGDMVDVLQLNNMKLRNERNEKVRDRDELARLGDLAERRPAAGQGHDGHLQAQGCQVA